MTRPTLAALAFSAVAAAGVATSSVASAATISHSSTTVGTSTKVTHPVHHSTRPSAKSGTATRTYIVKPGDSFWSIAHDLKVNWFNLAADNHLQMFDVIHPGQHLVIPKTGEKNHAPMPLTSGSVPQVSSPVSAAPVSGATQTSPAPTASSSVSSSSASVSPTSSFQACVIQRESGGNPDASNGSHWGLYQFSPSTWAAYGGAPGAYGSASAAQQTQVFDNAMAAGGESNWAPYDGC